MTVIGALAQFQPSDKLVSATTTTMEIYILCKATTLNMNPRESTSTTTGSTLSPGDSSVYNPGGENHASALVVQQSQPRKQISMHRSSQLFHFTSR